MRGTRRVGETGSASRERWCGWRRSSLQRGSHRRAAEYGCMDGCREGGRVEDAKLGRRSSSAGGSRSGLPGLLTLDTRGASDSLLRHNKVHGIEVHGIARSCLPQLLDLCVAAATQTLLPLLPILGSQLRRRKDRDMVLQTTSGWHASWPPLLPGTRLVTRICRPRA